MVKMILCIDLNGYIGKDNDLLFKMKEDMAFFREQTMNNIVIMGYNTWLSLGEKPLPNRTNIVMTDEKIKNIQTSTDLVSVIKDYEKYPQDIFIIGGAYVYNQALKLNLVDEILVTLVRTRVKDATVRVDIELFERFEDKEIIKTFINNEGDKVEIWRMRK
jgi:dihydrofolate reductase